MPGSKTYDVELVCDKRDTLAGLKAQMAPLIGFDGVENTFDEGEGDGEWYGYHMIGCEPIVKTDENGYAKIIVEFDQALCTLANQDDDTNECTWDDFTASLSATLLIPEITTSDPLDILLVRSPDTCD